MFDLLTLAAAIPATGDSFPVKLLLIIVGVAAAIAIVTAVISGKKNDNDK